MKAVPISPYRLRQGPLPQVAESDLLALDQLLHPCGYNNRITVQPQAALNQFPDQHRSQRLTQVQVSKKTHDRLQQEYLVEGNFSNQWTPSQKSSHGFYAQIHATHDLSSRYQYQETHP
jgi:hypothetical protein